MDEGSSVDPEEGTSAGPAVTRPTAEVLNLSLQHVNVLLNIESILCNK